MAVQQFNERAVGVFPSRNKAEEALNELKSSGFPMDRVSVLAKDVDRNEQVGGAQGTQGREPGKNEAPEGAGIGATAGTVLGGVGGLLVGLEALIIPGIGPFLAAGTVATTLAGAGIGAAAGGIVGGLTGAGIPEEQAQVYGDRLSEGDYLVIVDGSEGEIDRAGSILKKHGVREWNIYNTEGKSSAAPSRSANPNAAPAVKPTQTTAVNKTSTTAVDRTTVDNDPEVEIIDKRDQVR